MFKELTKFMDSFLKMGIPFYDCIVMKDGKCVYRHANGYTDINEKTEVTGKELDTLAEIAWQQEGVIGSRMTGAGFGGSTVSLVKNDAIDADLAGRRLLEVVHAAQQRALARTGRADDDDDFLLLDREVDALEHLDVAK